MKRSPLVRKTLTPAKVRELIAYDPESGVLRWRERGLAWFNTKYAGSPIKAQVDARGRLRACIFGKRYFLHRLAWAHHYGRWPRRQIDHINGNVADNRIANLRDVCCATNQKNRKRPVTNRTGHIGVFSDRGKWVARIGSKRIGTFATLEQAVAARNSAARRLRYHKNHGRDAQIAA